MTENDLFENMDPYQNPDCLPLENLKLKIKIEGFVESVDALSERWAVKSHFLHYEAPIIYDDDGSEITGAKEHWIQIVNYIIKDLKLLLNLPFYKFWSTMVFNTSTLDTLVSFSQEAPPFYALENFPNCPQMLKLYKTLHHHVLMVFTRLITNKQSPKEYMTRPFLGNLLYEKYIFTVPLIFELCQLYGRENEKVIKRILECLFRLEPRYNDDLEKVAPCLIEALQNVANQFDNYSTEYTNEAISLPEQNARSLKLTLFNFEDITVYLLDIASTVSVFLKCHPAAVSIFHTEDFMNKIVSIYGSTIPEMYKTCSKLMCDGEHIPKYIELKHRLDVTRMEMLNLYRTIIYEPILNIQENVVTVAEADIKEAVDKYLTLLCNAISEKVFITDYDQHYPFQLDLTTLFNICPEPDTIQYQYILKSIDVTVGKSSTSSIPFSNNINEPVAGPSGVSREEITFSNKNSSDEKKHSKKIDSLKLVTLVSEVKDIFHDLDERFIEMCLDYYNYNVASVINAILEETLPSKLKELKEETRINNVLSSKVECLNVRDYDDVCVKTREVVEVPKDYIVKNYSLVDDYEDDYDDTYDDRDIRGNAHDDSVEADSRPFTTPRVFINKEKIETVDEWEPEDEETVLENKKDHFIQNPEDIRAKNEQRRQAIRGGRTASNVIGNRKGQGQDEDVKYNRDKKNTNKSKRANHNRRNGAQFKRNQGMIRS